MRSTAGYVTYALRRGASDGAIAHQTSPTPCAGRVGGRVLGLATAQLAANVLRDEGLTAMNITAFLRRFTPDHQGRVRDGVQPGDLFIVDETSMTDTADLAKITDLVRPAAGNSSSSATTTTNSTPSGRRTARAAGRRHPRRAHRPRPRRPDSAGCDLVSR